jgi:hypothetical protein
MDDGHGNFLGLCDAASLRTSVQARDRAGCRKWLKVRQGKAFTLKFQYAEIISIVEKALSGPAAQ